MPDLSDNTGEKHTLGKDYALDILESLPNPLITIDKDNNIFALNAAAEIFFDGSIAFLKGLPLTELIPSDMPLFNMIEQARLSGNSITDHDLVLESLRIGIRDVNIGVSSLSDNAGHIVISLFERSIAQRLHSQQQYQGAARSVSGMAVMLAHEVKNPLSGIRGAAQLLAETIDDNDQSLAKLICDETDRICALVDKMEVFADERPLQKTSVNLHEILDHCRRLALAGFGCHIQFHENYDPSLPAALASRDTLIQMFLNLLKNACEAAPRDGGEIRITTAYRHGMSIKIGGSQEKLHVPLMVSIQDNGPGIPDELIPAIFDPFVTSKANGTGLGLAFVAKAVSDHGGFIEVDSVPRNTIIRVTLPVSELHGSLLSMPSKSLEDLTDGDRE
ncbi:MAG: two-component sensor histidine kinase [Rhodospirillaceae bacterium]|nr:two-component sensor histidine kinase [Rhodospirillaceae bacterium]